MKKEFTITICLCPSCGAERVHVLKFCSQCGTKLIVNGLFFKVEEGEIKEVSLTK